MSGCQFTIPFSKSAEEILDKARTAIESQGGKMEGNLEQGTYEVTLLSQTIKGSYRVEGQTLNMDITDKPMFVPCNAIEGYLKQKLN